jgi:hypothetical protein
MEARRLAAQECERLADRGQGCVTLQSVVPAACQGRVSVLFTALDTQVWGTHNEETGNVHLHESRDPLDEDLLDVAAERTLAHGGTVYAVPADEVPCGGAAAATLRY